MQYGTQTVINNISPDQIAEMLRSIVREEVRTVFDSHIPVSSLPDALPEYMSRREVKDFLGVSYTTLTNWSKDTEEQAAVLIPHKINTRIRYRREDVLAIFKKSRRFKAHK